MINKYYDFLLESMVNESKVVFSNNFRTILRKVGDSISDKVISIENKDLDVTSNYIDIDKEKNDTVTFTPDRRAQEIINDPTEYVRFTGRGGGWLKISPANKPIFDRLGFIPSSEEAYSPNAAEIGTIISKTKSNTTDKEFIYVKFPGGEGVFNLEKLRILPNTDKESVVWSKFRQEVRVGRIVRALLSSNKETFTDRDIELFVNNYKAAIDKFNDKFSFFHVVTGDDIHKWYDNSKYASHAGSLGSSCMSSASSSKLSLYTENDKISLVIYKSPENEEKILGRAILWTLVDGKKFMDRVYSNRDSDENLFHEFAKENEFYYKGGGHSSTIYSPEGESTDINLIVQIKPKMEKFPYVDTLSWYNYTTGLIGKVRSELGDGVFFSLHCTDGGIDEGYCSGCRNGEDDNCSICKGEAYRKFRSLYDQDDYDDDYMEDDDW